MNDTRYVQPGWFTKHVFNGTVRALARVGIGLAGASELRVRGRKSGEWHGTPVNPLTVDGERYLVAPRGTTQWVRNIRVSGEGELRRGRHAEPFRAVEVADADKLPMLREYVAKWGWEVGQFFEGVDKNATDAELMGIAAGFPVFHVVAA